MEKKEKIIRHLNHEIDASKVKQTLEGIGLPKWPALVVSGNNVTKDQAKEIIIRTTNFSFSSNDRDFEKKLYDILGIEKEQEFGYPDIEDIRRVNGEIQKVPDLEYLGNHQVVSSWIGGPHGWCSWDGVIFTNNYNIGKWPSCTKVYEELSSIAQAFPFLDMSCQLFSGETCDENIKCVIQFDVFDGLVNVVEPRRLAPPASDNVFDTIMRIGMANGERGCTIEQFKDAYEYVKEKFSNDKEKESSIDSN